MFIEKLTFVQLVKSFPAFYTSNKAKEPFSLPSDITGSDSGCSNLAATWSVLVVAAVQCPPVTQSNKINTDIQLTFIMSFCGATAKRAPVMSRGFRLKMFYRKNKVDCLLWQSYGQINIVKLLVDVVAHIFSIIHRWCAKWWFFYEWSCCQATKEL